MFVFFLQTGPFIYLFGQNVLKAFQYITLECYFSLGCPYTALTEGPISERLTPLANKLHLLDFLLTELQAARMTAVNKPHLLQKTVQVADSVREFITCNSCEIKSVVCN